MLRLPLGCLWKTVGLRPLRRDCGHIRWASGDCSRCHPIYSAHPFPKGATNLSLCLPSSPPPTLSLSPSHFLSFSTSLPLHLCLCLSPSLSLFSSFSLCPSRLGLSVSFSVSQFLYMLYIFEISIVIIRSIQMGKIQNFQMTAA